MCYDEVRYVAIYSLNANTHVYGHVNLLEIYLYNVKVANSQLERRTLAEAVFIYSGPRA